MKLKSWFPFLFLLYYFSLFGDIAAELAVRYRNEGYASPYAKQHSTAALTETSSSAPLIPTDLVLVSTLDGSIRGVDRLEGRVYWTLQGGPGGSLIKSSTHFKSRMEASTDDGDLHTSSRDPPIFDIISDDEEDENEDYLKDGYLALGQQPSASKSKVDHAPPHRHVYYIVEPSNGGTLYLYSEDEQGHVRPLEKLPFTVEDIVMLSPHRTADGTTYIGRKSTVMIAIDPRTGKILQKFDLSRMHDVRKMAAGGELPPHTIFLGRHEYKLAIFNGDNEKWWNVTYSEFVPNRLDWDLPLNSAPAEIYIAPDASRAVTGIKVSTGDLMWSLDLPYPVVSVFDVFRRPDYTIVLSKQEAPHHTLTKGNIGRMLSMLKRGDGRTTAYVGIHDGSLYALSTERFPLVQISQWSSIYTDLPPGATWPMIESGDKRKTGDPDQDDDDSYPEWRPKPHYTCCAECDYHTDCLVGQHVVREKKVRLPATLPPSEISTPIVLPPGTLPPGPLYEEPKTGFFYDGMGKFWKSYVLGLAVLLYFKRQQAMQLYTIYAAPILTWLVTKFRDYKSTKQRKPSKSKNKKHSTTPASSQTSSTPTSIPTSASPPTSIASISSEPKTVKESNNSVPSSDDMRGTSHSPTKSSSTSQQHQSSSLQSDPTSTATQLISNPLTTDTETATAGSKGIDLEKFESKPKVLSLSDTVLGYGSHGTVVYEGYFDGRTVAVKRLLIDFYDIAYQEVKLLQESDDHPNVIRYFYKEETDRFLYIALELCYGSLHDFMERSLTIPNMQLFDQMNPANILYQIMCGIRHLHSLKIVHRDIKPQNILLAPNRHRKSDDPSALRILISDFGLCKKLDGEASSFHYTAASPAGTSGWRAPELLAGALSAKATDTSLSSQGDRHGRHGTDPNRIGPVKATRAIDIFSAGCVFYYVLSGGEHPFGNRFGRESNILKNDYDLSKLKNMGEDGVEVTDLIERMIHPEPRSRPTADMVLLHPFFWSPAKRLAFLQDASDRFEVEQRDPPSLLLQQLETNAESVIGHDWYRKIDRVFANDLGKFRKYDGKRVRDLLRALRNKKHHWQDLPPAVKRTLGEPPDNYLYYFTARFPRLLLHTYYVIANDAAISSEGTLRQYF